jgi:hypothetical protein
VAEPIRVTITAELTYAEAVALATVFRQLRPPDDIAAAWYSALDKFSKQLPATLNHG